jgi:hypothetical protein
MAKAFIPPPVASVRVTCGCGHPVDRAVTDAPPPELCPICQMKADEPGWFERWVFRIFGGALSLVILYFLFLVVRKLWFPG